MHAFLIQAARSRPWLFLVSTLSVLALKCSTVLPAILLGDFLDDLGRAPSTGFESVVLPLAILFSLTLVQAVINPFQTYQLVRCVQYTLRDHCSSWTLRLFGKDYDVFESLRLGALIKSFERGIDAHEKLLTFMITIGLPLVLEIFTLVIALLYLGGVALFFSLVIAACLYLWSHYRLVRWRRAHIDAVNDAEEHVASKLFESLQAGKSIKLEQAELGALSSLIASYASYAHAAVRVAASGAFLGSARVLFTGTVSFGLLGWGALELMQPHATLTTGTLIAMLSIAGNFCLGIGNLAEAHRTLDQFILDKRSFEHTLALPDFPGRGAGNRTDSIEHLMLLRPRQHPLRLSRDRNVAIIGASGAGKSTLLEALAGVNASRRDDLWINSQPLSATDLGWYQSQIRYCPQACTFIGGTFREAVIYGFPEAPSLASHMQALGLDAFTARSISANGCNISGGEARRLTLLRLLNRPGVFNLFDEPTAALDQATAVRTWDVLFRAFSNRALVCVTHDLGALSRFDCVWVMAHGEVIAEGPWPTIRDNTRVQQVLRDMEQPAG